MSFPFGIIARPGRPSGLGHARAQPGIYVRSDTTASSKQFHQSFSSMVMWMIVSAWKTLQSALQAKISLGLTKVWKTFGKPASAGISSRSGLKSVSCVKNRQMSVRAHVWSAVIWNLWVGLQAFRLANNGQLSLLDNSYSMCELEQFASIKSVHSIRTVELSVVIRYHLQHSSLPHLNNGHTPSDMCASRSDNLHHRDRYYKTYRIIGTIGTLCCVCNIRTSSIKWLLALFWLHVNNTSSRRI